MLLATYVYRYKPPSVDVKHAERWTKRWQKCGEKRPQLLYKWRSAVLLHAKNYDGDVWQRTKQALSPESTHWLVAFEIGKGLLGFGSASAATRLPQKLRYDIDRFYPSTFRAEVFTL